MTYPREYFTSQPHQAMVVRFTASWPGSYSGSIALADSHVAKSIAVGKKFRVTGALANGLKYDCQLATVHGPREDGVSYNQQIVWDLFNNYVEAADALGVDKPYREGSRNARQACGSEDRQVGPVAGVDGGRG